MWDIARVSSQLEIIIDYNSNKFKISFLILNLISNLNIDHYKNKYNI